MQLVLILALAGFWLALAGFAATHGQLGRAGFYLVAGTILTIWRISRLRGGGPR
jgi:hypothetical protein